MLHLLPIEQGYKLEILAYSVKENVSAKEKDALADALGKIQRCVKGYAGSSLFYRITNMIKAIFGCSDWQIAKRALSEYTKIVKPLGAISFDRRYDIKKIFELMFPGKTCRTDNPDDYLEALVALNKKTSRSALTILTGETIVLRELMVLNSERKCALEKDYLGFIQDLNVLYFHLQNISEDEIVEPPDHLKQEYEQILKKEAEFSSLYEKNIKAIRERKDVDETFKKLLPILNDIFDEIFG